MSPHEPDTSAPEALEHFRVTVRGRFVDLDDAVRRFLVTQQSDHDIFLSAFTEEGTFTYDARIDFFNLRYEVKTNKGSDAAVHQALTNAAAFLKTMKIGHSQLKGAAMDMTDMMRRN